MQKVIVWGCGKYYKFKKNTIEKNFLIEAIVDKNHLGDKIDGYRVIDKNDIDKYKFDAIVVMSADYLFEIVNEIINMGIENNKILLGINFPPHTIEEQQYITRQDCLSVDKNGNILWGRNKVKIESKEAIEQLINSLLGHIKKETIQELPVMPASYGWGVWRGYSIARYFIDKFVEKYKTKISGNVMEIGDKHYTNMGERVSKCIVLDLDSDNCGIYVRGNLETGVGIPKNDIDCLILTNVLSSLLDVNAAIRNALDALKKKGRMIITVPGIAGLDRNQNETYGCYWRFTPTSLLKLLRKYAPKAEITIETYGNAKTSAAFLYGMAVEDLSMEDLGYIDESYPLVIGAYLELI